MNAAISYASDKDINGYFGKDNRLVLGTAGLGGIWGKVSEKESVYSIHTALDHQIKAIDTAPAYSEAENYLGKALKSYSGAKPFVSSKAGRLKSRKSDEAIYDYSTKGLEKSVENSLRVLGLDCLDILFLHDPDAIPIPELSRIIDDLLVLKEKGYTKALGLGGNFKDEAFFEYLNPDCLSVFMGYNRLNAIKLEAGERELKYAKDKGIGYYQASPLYMGLLGAKYKHFSEMPPDWISLGDIEKAKGLKKLAAHHQIDMASLALRFLFSVAAVDRIVIGASNNKELLSTLQDWERGVLEEEIFNEILRYNKVYAK